MHHFVTKMCQCVHISVTKWCIVGCLCNALWDWWDGFINCHKMGRSSPSPPDEGFQLLGHPLNITMVFPGWRHQMETFSALLALCAGNSPVPVNSPHKGQWRGALMFTLICARINDWVNNREAGDLRRLLDHYDVSVMIYTIKIRQSSLIFVMGIPLRHLYIEIIPKTLSVLRTDRKHKYGSKVCHKILACQGLNFTENRQIMWWTTILLQHLLPMYN